MNKFLVTSVLMLVLATQVIAQTTIDVAENTLKINGRAEEVLYYAFAEGDQVIFNYEEVNGKELKALEITELPSTLKFADYKTKKINNKTINITSSGVYKFKFSNTGYAGRICKIKIQRRPASEATKRFSTSVYWKTVYDTIYDMVQEKHLVKKEFKPIAILPTTEYYVNSGSNATFKGGKSRITFPVTLPKNTQEWYYVFSASRDKAALDKARGAFNLVKQLARLIDETGALTFSVDMLSSPPGGNVCDVYLLDNANSKLFEEKQSYTYIESGSRENIKSGIIKMNAGAGQSFYIGIKNPDSFYGIQIAIEVVAVVLEEKWETQGTPKLKVVSRQEAYFKN
jgi:hypothetical protein